MQKIKDFGKLVKFRVNIIVVLSSIFGYFIASGSESIIFTELLGLALGGFFTTGAAHAINQLFETKYDGIMSRTVDRPLPTGRMTKWEVISYATIIIGMSSLLIYSFIYTPLKRITPLAVVVGAIPGALPPTIGYIAVTGEFNNLALLLFLFQFVWQFPHFWSIAWIWNDEYNKAGYDLLPFKNGRTYKNALFTFLSSMILIPTLFLFYSFGHINIYILVVSIFATFWFIYRAYVFYKKPDISMAKRLMLGSVIYLPIIQLIFLIAFWNN